MTSFCRHKTDVQSVGWRASYLTTRYGSGIATRVKDSLPGRSTWVRTSTIHALLKISQTVRSSTEILRKWLNFV